MIFVTLVHFLTIINSLFHKYHTIRSCWDEKTSCGKNIHRIYCIWSFYKKCLSSYNSEEMFHQTKSNHLKKHVMNWCDTKRVLFSFDIAEWPHSHYHQSKRTLASQRHRKNLRSFPSWQQAPSHVTGLHVRWAFGPILKFFVRNPLLIHSFWNNLLIWTHEKFIFYSGNIFFT